MSQMAVALEASSAPSEPTLGSREAPSLEPASTSFAPEGSMVDRSLDVRARRQLKGPGNVQRVALLGLMMSRLSALSLEQAADFLGVRPARLIKMMHGEEVVPKNLADKWENLAEVLRNVLYVLQPSAIDRWLETPMADLNGTSPLEALRRGRAAEVLELTRKYLDNSFT